MGHQLTYMYFKINQGSCRKKTELSPKLFLDSTIRNTSADWITSGEKIEKVTNWCKKLIFCLDLSLIDNIITFDMSKILNAQNWKMRSYWTLPPPLLGKKKVGRNENSFCPLLISEFLVIYIQYTMITTMRKWVKYYPHPLSRLGAVHEKPLNSFFCAYSSVNNVEMFWQKL